MMPGLGGVDPRQMAMMMRKMGIEVEEIEGVQEVLVRTASRDYRFRKASVSVMKAQGTETWQIQGKPEVVEKGAPLSASPATAQAVPVPTNVPQAAGPVDIPDGDVRLVMEQAGCDERRARKTLEETGGDLAEALVRLGK